MGHLHLALLGSPEVYHPLSPPNTLSFTTRKTLALLLYLAVEESPQARERITALLWPESNTELGRSSLRKTLAYLRQALGEGDRERNGERNGETNGENTLHLLASRDLLRLNPASAVSVDVWWLRAAAQAAQHPLLTTAEMRATLSSTHLHQLLKPLQQAVDAYRGDFLAGFSLNDAPDFDDWAGMQREIVHHQAILVFDRLSQLQFEMGDLSNAVGTTVNWVAQDALNEAAYRRLMQLHIASGNRSAALQSYQACRAMLAREFDAEPEAETEELASRIRETRTLRSPKSNPRSTAEVGATTLLLDGETPLIGRTFEHVQLVNAFRTVEASTGQTGKVQIMTLEGEPGIGKTRLATEFLRWAEAQGAQILHGRALEVHGRLPYQPIVAALRLALPSLQPRLATAVANARGPLTKLWLAELSRLLPELHDHFPDLPPPPMADEAEVRLRLFEAITRMGGLLAEAGVLVFFVDDLQWADAASLEVLQYAVRRWGEMQRPVLLLFALRDEEVSANRAVSEWLHTVRRDAPLTRLTLRLLTAEETQQIVQAMSNLQSTKPSELTPFSQLLFAETQGQPFFIVQTLRSLLEHGLLHANEAGQLSIDLVRQLPSSVRELIQSRLLRLGETAQLYCACAAVLGNRFGFDPLCTVAGLSPETALPAVEELLTRNLWRELASEDASSPLLYAFSHDRIRDVAYAQLSEARRRLLHRLALEALAQSAPPSELARHAWLAGLPERAFTLKIEAGDGALHLFAVRDAIDLYEEALQLYQTNFYQPQPNASQASWMPQLFHLFQQLARAYQVSSQPEQLHATMTAMLALAQQVGNGVMEVWALNRLATSQAHLQADLDNPLTLLQRARQIAEAHDDKSGLAETEWNLAQLHFYNVHIQVALGHAQAALSLARTLGQSELLARTLNILSYLNSDPAHWTEAESYGREAYTIYMATQDRSMTVDSLCLIARAQYGLGNPQAGLEAAQSAQRLVQEFENPWGKTNATLHLAHGALETGDYGLASAYAQEAAEIARSHHLTTILCIVHILQGNIYRALGQLENARQIHAEAAGYNEAMASHPFSAPIAMAQCVDALFSGDWTGAAEWSAKWLETRATSLDFCAELEFCYWIEVLLHTGQSELALREIAIFGEQFAHNPRYRIAHLRGLGVLAAWQGEQHAAITYWQEAHALAGQLGIVHEQRQIEQRHYA